MHISYTHTIVYWINSCGLTTSILACAASPVEIFVILFVDTAIKVNLESANHQTIPAFRLTVPQGSCGQLLLSKHTQGS